MARINIDDELHAEKRFKRLVKKLKDGDKAIGLLYRFWHMAQDYWGDECGLMPQNEFEEEGFTPILEVGLAQKRDAGIYAEGSEERFDWYLQRKRASKEAVRARANKKAENSDDRKSNSGTSEAVVRPLGKTTPNNLPAPALSSASVPSSVPSSATASAGLCIPGAYEAEAPPGAGLTIGKALEQVYIDGIRQRYGLLAQPLIDHKGRDVLAFLLEQHGYRDAAALVEAYCDMDIDKKWFEQQSHNLLTLKNHLPAVSLELSRRRKKADAANACADQCLDGVIEARSRDGTSMELFRCRCSRGTRLPDAPVWNSLDSYWTREIKTANGGAA